MYYDKIRHRHSQVLAATGLTPVEFDALLVTFKYHWDENGEATEPEDSIVGVLSFGGGEYLFRQELPVPEGAKRKFREFSAEQIFSHCA